MKFFHTILLLFLSIAMIQGTFLRGEDEEEDRLRELGGRDYDVARLRPHENRNYCVRPEKFKSRANLLISHDCDGSKPKFIKEERSDGFVLFKSYYHPRYCIGASRIKNRKRVRLYRCRNTSKQRWYFDEDTGRIHPKGADDLCLVFRGHRLNKGDHLKLLYCDEVEDQEDHYDDQRWYTGNWDF